MSTTNASAPAHAPVIEPDLNTLFGSSVAGIASLVLSGGDGRIHTSYSPAPAHFDLPYRQRLIEWGLLEYSPQVVAEHVRNMRELRAKAHYHLATLRAAYLSDKRLAHRAQLDASPPTPWKFAQMNPACLSTIEPMRYNTRKWGAMFGRDYSIWRAIPDNAPGKLKLLVLLCDKHYDDLHLLYASSRTAPRLPEPVRAYLDAKHQDPSTGRIQWHPLLLDWLEAGGMSLRSGHNRLQWLMAHVSEDDPSQVAYYPSYQKMMRGLLTRCRVGRFLSSQFGDLLSDEQIKACVGHHGIAHPGKSPEARASTTLRFIENDDPAGWEWVYEHGHKFSSCMCHAPDPKRNSPHVSSDLTGKDHPVRAYAYRGNGLRLAYLGDPVHTVGGKVYARAIVRDDCPHGSGKQWVRVFGDDSIATYLKAAGYQVADASSVLEGLKLRRREHPTHEHALIVPYIDADDSFEDCGTYLLVTSSGDLSANSPSGYVSMDPQAEQFCCNRCGASHDDEDYLHYSEHEETDYCDSCEDNFTYALVSRLCSDMVLNENVVEVGGEAYVDDNQVLAQHDIYPCAACDDPHPLDDMTSTGYGLTCNCTDIVSLHEECPEGFEQAREDDAIQYYSREQCEWVWLHEDTDADEDDYREYGPHDPRCVDLAVEDEEGWDYALRTDAVELHDPDTGALTYLHEDMAHIVDEDDENVEYDPDDLDQWARSPVIRVWADSCPLDDDRYWLAVHPHIRDWHGPAQDSTTGATAAQLMALVRSHQHQLPLGETHANTASTA